MSYDSESIGSSGGPPSSSELSPAPLRMFTPTRRVPGASPQQRYVM
jgi:hypothetical protein